jgi:hypothetical protein
MLSCYKNNAVLLKSSPNYQKITFIIPKLSLDQLQPLWIQHLTLSSVATLHSIVADPDPHQIERHDPDPHQSDELDPRQFADDKAKIMEYELIIALFPGFKPFFCMLPAN